MAILEGLGPSGKLFEDLPPGEYLFEVSEPGDKGWIAEYKDDSNPKAITNNVNWSLRVLKPEEHENRRFFHQTMYYASPEKIAQAKRPYDPSGFFYQFLVGIGAATKDGNNAVILDDYLTDGEPDLDKMIGLRFHATVIMDTFVSKKTGESQTRAKLDPNTIYPE